jgi:hypothetical protein
MYCTMMDDNTRRDILDVSNEEIACFFKCAAIVTVIMIMLMGGDTINGTHAHV